MVDPVDHYAVQQLNEFDGRGLKSTKREIWSRSQSCKERGGGYERVVEAIDKV